MKPSAIRLGLRPCRPIASPSLDDEKPHIVNINLEGDYLRVKIDGVAYYPRSAGAQTCTKWSFFRIKQDRRGKFFWEPRFKTEQLKQSFDRTNDPLFDKKQVKLS